jgi:hypothetical protein
MQRFISTLRFICAALIALTAFGFAQPARADDLDAADASSVRAVIEAQLAAFAQDDAPRAFSFATPQLRESFGSAANFLEMVRRSYPVVYHHATVAFLKPEVDDGVVVQAVHFTDESGVLWIALYQLERQQDRTWRISGCHAVQTEGRAA